MRSISTPTKGDAFKRKDYLKTHTQVYDHSESLPWYHNERLQPAVLEPLRWDLIQRRKAYVINRWKPLWETIHALPYTEFWGWRYAKDARLPHSAADWGYLTGPTKILCKTHGTHPDPLSGLSTEYVRSNTELYRILPAEALPLRVNDRMSPDELKIYRGRCDGSIPQVPYRQDLVDEYWKVQNFCHHLNRAIHLCNVGMENYLYNKYHKTRSHTMEKETVKLVIHGRTYWYEICHAGSSVGVKLLLAPELEPITEVIQWEALL